ncbi:MAG: hypothetical protein AAF249_06035 [Pseudomonadota bacterium]
MKPHTGVRQRLRWLLVTAVIIAGMANAAFFLSRDEPQPPDIVTVDVSGTADMIRIGLTVDVLPSFNQIDITDEGVLLWNCEPKSLSALKSRISDTIAMPVEPILVLHAEPQADFAAVRAILRQISKARVAKLELVGLRQHKTFGFERTSMAPEEAQITDVALVSLLDPPPDTSRPLDYTKPVEEQILTCDSAQPV